MELILGYITIMGIIIGGFTIYKGNKRHGIIQLLLNVIMLLFTMLFLKSKLFFDFSGSDNDYLIVRGLSGKTIEPLILFIVFVNLMVIMFINLFDLLNVKEKYKKRIIKKMKMIL